MPTYLIPAGTLVAITKRKYQRMHWRPYRTRRSLSFDYLPYSDSTGCVFTVEDWFIHVRDYYLRRYDVCNRFEVDTDGATLAYQLGAQMMFEDSFWESEIFPMGSTPGLIHGEAQRLATPMLAAL